MYRTSADMRPGAGRGGHQQAGARRGHGEGGTGRTLDNRGANNWHKGSGPIWGGQYNLNPGPNGTRWCNLQAGGIGQVRSSHSKDPRGQGRRAKNRHAPGGSSSSSVRAYIAGPPGPDANRAGEQDWQDVRVCVGWGKLGAAQIADTETNRLYRRPVPSHIYVYLTRCHLRYGLAMAVCVLGDAGWN